MTHTQHALTRNEIEAGVTLQMVASMMPKILMRNDRVIMPHGTPAALAGSMARCAFGEPAEYTGINALGQAIYRRVVTPIHPGYPGQSLEQSIQASCRGLGI